MVGVTRDGLLLMTRDAVGRHMARALGGAMLLGWDMVGRMDLDRVEVDL